MKPTNTLLLKHRKGAAILSVEECIKQWRNHVLQKGIMVLTDVYAELGEIISGKKPGRTSGNEIIVFDSTRTALQDVATAVIVFEKAVAGGIGKSLDFSE